MYFTHLTALNRALNRQLTVVFYTLNRPVSISELKGEESLLSEIDKGRLTV